MLKRHKPIFTRFYPVDLAWLVVVSISETMRYLYKIHDNDGVTMIWQGYLIALFLFRPYSVEWGEIRKKS